MGGVGCSPTPSESARPSEGWSVSAPFGKLSRRSNGLPVCAMRERVNRYAGILAGYVAPRMARQIAKALPNCPPIGRRCGSAFALFLSFGDGAGAARNRKYSFGQVRFIGNLC